MSNYLGSNTYANDTNIRPSIGGPSPPSGDHGGGCGDDCPWGINPALYIISWIFICIASLIFCTFLCFTIDDYCVRRRRRAREEVATRQASYRTIHERSRSSDAAVEVEEQSKVEVT